MQGMGEGEHISGQVLVVEDEPRLGRAIRTMLLEHGYDCWAARTGKEALDLIRSEKFDLVLLDLNLPDMPGIEVCRQIRAGFDVAIVVVTVRDNEDDKVAAFNAGADDYVTKPFNIQDLTARIRAQLRWRKTGPEAPAEVFRLDDTAIDFAKRTITRGGKEISLSPKQCQLLRYFVTNRGKALSHRKLLQAVWGADYGDETALLQAVIAQLRKKIESDPGEPRYIVTISGLGYRFEGPA